MNPNNLRIDNPNPISDIIRKLRSNFPEGMMLIYQEPKPDVTYVHGQEDASLISLLGVELLETSEPELWEVPSSWTWKSLRRLFRRHDVTVAILRREQ